MSDDIGFHSQIDRYVTDISFFDFIVQKVINHPAKALFKSPSAP